MRLCQIHVDEGCIQLTFQVPLFVRQKVFPLCKEQEKALGAMGVTKLTRGEYQFLVRLSESTCLNTYCRCGMRHWGVGCVVLWIFSVSLQKTESPHAGNGMYVHCRLSQTKSSANHFQYWK